jgi:AcrR family transcriptional regulator
MSHHSMIAGSMGSIGPSASQFDFRARRAMVAAAKECFARRGVEAVTLAEIAKVANIGEAEALAAYGSKAKLLLAVFDEAWALINPRLADVIATSPDARKAMTSMLSTAAYIMQKDRALARLMLLESYRIQGDSGQVLMSRGYGVFIQIATALVERGQAQGCFKTSYHPRVIVSLVLASVQGLMRDALLAEESGGSNPYSTSQLMAAFEAVVSSLAP